MITLKEIKNGNTSIFKKIYYNSKGTIFLEEIINLRLFKVNIDNFDTLILYNNNMEVLTSVYRFINFEMGNQSYNSREKSIYAIKFLYYFFELTKTSIDTLDRTKIEQLKYFLLGYSPNKGSYSMDLKTTRTNSTVNGYLNIYRSYLNYLNIDCKYLSATKISNLSNINSLTDQPTKIRSYKSNLKTGTPENIVPKYISINDFSKIIKIFRNEKNLLAECIVRLMYQFGLRLGEILGLTFEDITEININGTLHPVLYIRNRLSDKPFQYAKSCMNISNTSQYKNKDYKTLNYGYQKIIITYDIYELLNQYINIYHQKARNKNLNRYSNKVKADQVLNNKYETNYYVFINSIGTILSNQTWNKYLRSVFLKANLHIDTNYKKTNLNHRFRHGFAMFHVKHRKTPIVELQKLMRHSSVSSTMLYYNPTAEDEKNIKNKFVNELYSLIPELKEAPKYDN